MKDIITFEELMKELEKHRMAGTSLATLKPEQKKFLIACRGKPPYVSFMKIAVLWERAGWGRTSENTMRRIWKRLEDQTT